MYDGTSEENGTVCSSPMVYTNLKEVPVIIGSSSYALPWYLFGIESLVEVLKELFPPKQSLKAQLVQDLREIEIRIQSYKNNTLRSICELERPEKVEEALLNATDPTILLISDVLQAMGQSVEKKFYQEILSSDEKFEDFIEEIFYINYTKFPHKFQKRIEKLFSSYKAIIQKNAKSYTELMNKQAVIIDFVESIFTISLSIQVGIILIIEISKGNLSLPKFEVMEEIIYRTTFLSNLFRQKSRRHLWSKTTTGQEQNGCLRSLTVKAKQIREQRDRILTSEEKIALKERNQQLYQELQTVRENANRTRE